MKKNIKLKEVLKSLIKINIAIVEKTNISTNIFK